MNFSLFTQTTCVMAEGAIPKNLTWTVTLAGVSVVFSVLLLLAFFIWLYSSIVASLRANLAKKETLQEQTSVVTSEIPEPKEENNSELIAVLTAAIMASMNYQPTCNLRIKSFKRVNGSATAWNNVGRTEY